jgi:hypothetical protein
MPEPAPRPSIEIFDTTLRDGAQTEGISYSVDDKLRIARKLDALGVAYIEGGWPGSNPKDVVFFAGLRHLRQVLGPAGPGDPPHDAGGKPANDRGHGDLPARTGEAGHL